jgi:hypothetical protein
MDAKSTLGFIEDNAEFKAMTEDLALLRAEVGNIAEHMKSRAVTMAENATDKVSTETNKFFGIRFRIWNEFGKSG